MRGKYSQQIYPKQLLFRVATNASEQGSKKGYVFGEKRGPARKKVRSKGQGKEGEKRKDRRGPSNLEWCSSDPCISDLPIQGHLRPMYINLYKGNTESTSVCHWATVGGAANFEYFRQIKY